MADVQFIGGLIVKAPNPKAPEFVKASLSIKREDLIAWLQSQDGEWINADIKESRSGKWYASVNDFKPNSGQSDRPAQRQESKPREASHRFVYDDPDSIPF